MSYLHPAYYQLLPPTARPQLIAYLQLVDARAHASSDGWCDMRQAALARELGRSPRNVQRYEAVCAAVGVLEVQHGQRGNRRRVRLRTAKAARQVNGTQPAHRPAAASPERTLPAHLPLREWRHGCRHSADTRVVTLGDSHLLPRARSLRGSSSDSQTPKPAAPAERASHDRRDPDPISRPRISEQLLRRTQALAEPLGLLWAPKIAALVFRLARATGERQALGYLDIVAERTARAQDGYPRAKATLAMLEARLRKLSETRRR